MSDEVVYVIGTPANTVVKIGRTTRLVKRLADIQRMSPVPLAVLWTHPGGHELETNLHRHFAKIRSHGEWFTFDEDPVAAIQRAVLNAPWNAPKPPRLKPQPKPRLPSLPKRSRRVRPASPTPFALPADLQAELSLLPDINSKVERVRAIQDPVLRFHAAREIRQQFASEDDQLRQRQQTLVQRLKEGRTWAQVGKILGFSGSRAEAFAKGR